MKNYLPNFPLLLPLGSLALACTWLLPNHHKPWVGFHNDAWFAVVLLLVVTFRLRPWQGAVTSNFGIFCLALACLPLVQYGFGLLQLQGEAWVCTAYLYGFALSIVAGTTWRKTNGDEPLSFLACALLTAGIISVGLQIYQWLGMTNYDTMTDIGVLHRDGQRRPYGNIGQPNQLGTLLILGLLSLAWFCQKSWIPKYIALLLGVWITFGVVLTESRTAMLEGITAAFALVIWRKLWQASIVKTAIFLTLFSILLHLQLNNISEYFGIPENSLSFAERTLNDLRIPAWNLFLDASTKSPWFGYGWNGTLSAQITVINQHPAIFETVFSHGHNLFLDFLIWLGIPIGVLLFLLICWWLTFRVLNIRDTGSCLALTMITAIGIHAMLELPLHYAYFLLSTGFLCGTLEYNTPFGKARKIPPALWGLMLFSVSALLSIIISDYLKVEKSYLNMRFEMAKIGTQFDRTPADVILLTQLRDMIELTRSNPHPNMRKEQIEYIKAIMETYPSSYNMAYTLATLSLNDRHNEALDISKKYCHLFTPIQCAAAIKKWQADAKLTETAEISQK